jgi:hypothetical protein
VNRHLPSVVGCAIGFCAAGSGVGSVAGSLVGMQVWKGLSDDERAATSPTDITDLWMFRGIFAGMVLGVVAGVTYPLVVRWVRAGRKQAEPAAAPPPADG